MSKSEKYGLIGSVTTTALLILLLFLIVMPGLKTPEDEGIMISFGNANDGAGVTQTPAATAQPEPPAPKPVTPTTTPKVTPPKENLMTQKDPSVVAIEEQKKKERQEREAIERKKREEEQRLAEQKKKQDDIDNLVGGAIKSGGNSNSTGSGNTSGNTTQGNPAGSGTSGGNSWSLSGRSLRGTLVQPSYEKDVEGKITVSIRVDASGNVVSATIGTPTTISDSVIRNAALAAARSTKFSAGNSEAAGSITYNFRLR